MLQRRCYSILTSKKFKSQYWELTIPHRLEKKPVLQQQMIKRGSEYFDEHCQLKPWVIKSMDADVDKLEHEIVIEDVKHKQLWAKTYVPSAIFSTISLITPMIYLGATHFSSILMMISWIPGFTTFLVYNSNNVTKLMKEKNQAERLKQYAENIDKILNHRWD